MFCRHCCNMLPDRAKFCDSCGAPVEAPQEPKYAPPVYQQSQPYAQAEPYAQPHQGKPSVSFAEAIRLYFQGYAKFSGRSRRSEYWYAVLFTGILSAVIAGIIPDLSGILSLALLLPNLAVAVRRLHDTGKSGWYYLWGLVPIIGVFIVLIRLCKDSEGDNQWGVSPKYSA